MSEPTKETRRILRPEVPTSMGPFKLDFRLAWGAGAFLLALIVFLESLSHGKIPQGIGMVFLAAILFAVFLVVPTLKPGRNSRLGAIALKAEKDVAELTGQLKFTSDQPQTGEVFEVGGKSSRKPTKKDKVAKVKSDKRLGAINIVPFDTGATDGQGRKLPPIAITEDRRYQTLSATMGITTSSLFGLDTEDKELRQDTYAKLLDRFAGIGQPAYRLTWQVQTLLGEPVNTRGMVAEMQKLTRLSRRGGDFGQLEPNLAKLGKDSVTYRVCFTLTIHKPSVKRLAKQLGSPEVVLAEQLNVLYNTLTGGNQSRLGLQNASVLSYEDALRQNRLLIDPVFAQPLVYADAVPRPVDPNFAWTKSNDWTRDDSCRLGSTYHTGFYLVAPHSAVSLNQFEIMHGVRVPKTITTVIEMIPPSRALRSAEIAAQGASSSAREHAQMAGRFRQVQVVAAQEAESHELELAERVGQVGRTRTYVDVTGASENEAASNAHKLLVACSNESLVLEPMAGRQDEVIGATLRIGRGLATVSRPESLNF